jgi:hypothetical protein
MSVTIVPDGGSEIAAQHETKLIEEPEKLRAQLVDVMTCTLATDSSKVRHPFLQQDRELPENWADERDKLLKLYGASAKLSPAYLPDYEIADDTNTASFGELFPRTGESKDDVKVGVANLLQKHRQVIDSLFPTPPVIGLHKYFVADNAAKIGYDADAIMLITEIHIAPPPTQVYALLEGIRTTDGSKRLFDEINGGTGYQTMLNNFQILLAEMIILDYLVREKAGMAPKHIELRMEALQLAYDTLNEFRARKVG